MKNVYQTDKAPAALGPYSQAASVNGLLFVSGQLPIDPATGEMVEASMSERTKQILTNIATIAEEAGTTLQHTVKTTIFLTNLADFQEMNTTYATFFTDNPPARSTVQVAALPLGSTIEIEAVIEL